MEWWLTLSIIIGSLMVLMASGLPVAFSFLLLNIVCVYLLWHGGVGLNQMVYSMKSSVTVFALLPLVFFMLMGSVMGKAGVASHMIEAMNKLLGRLPGRISLLSVMTGAVFAALSGSSMGNVALLGKVLVPEAEKCGYKKSMSIGPVLASGGLAIMIPPTNIGVFMAVLAEVSVGDLLIAIIVPGILLAIIYATYIVIRCYLQPSLAPPYDIGHISLSKKLSDFSKYVLPLGFIIFLVTGLIFLGVATPGEAATVGCLGSFLLAFLYGRLNWRLVKGIIDDSLDTMVMVLLIIATATTFCQVLAFSGASRGLISFVLGLSVHPLLIIFLMQFVVLIMGFFMDVNGIILITIPLFMPIVRAVGFDQLAFIVIMLLNIETAMITPPFGLSLFIMKGVAPSNTTMKDIIISCFPYVVVNIMVIIVMIIFPVLTLWLPSLMR